MTAVHFVPSMWQLFTAQEEAAACRSLRLLFSGGEALPTSLQSEILARFPGVRLDNRYGPTEALINASRWTCREGKQAQGAHRPATCRYRRVRRPGRRHDAGAGRRAGRPVYRRRRPGARLCRRTGPDCRTFRSRSFFRAPPAGVFTGPATGRVGAPTACSNTTGRDDDQVKIRGFRVELQEVEAQLRQLPGVRAAAVTTHPGADGGASLAAYLVMAQPEPPLAELKENAASRLPDFMRCRRSWTVLDALPLMHNGKLDRSRLPKPALARGGYVRPRNEDERRIAGIWQEVLGAEAPGMRDNFFALGGHSLLATRIVARVRKHYGFDLPLRTIFEHSDLDAFCAAVMAHARERDTDPVLEPVVVDRTQALPCPTRRNACGSCGAWNRQTQPTTSAAPPRCMARWTPRRWTRRCGR